MLASLLRRYWLLLLPTVFFILLVLLAGQPLLMRKVVVFLVLPAGFTWVLLTYLICWPGIKLRMRSVLVVVWLLYSLAGNPIIGNRLMAALERPMVPYESPTETFDILFVLGGGTTATPGGHAQMGVAGDRVMKAVRLYKAGQVKTLAASGRSMTEVWGDRDLSAETMGIWREMGVPDADMIGFSDPANTKSELIAYRDYLQSLPEQPERIGICTSAWHMQRAQKLWQRLGIEATPVPADFRSTRIPVISTYLIPKKRGFADMQVALWEYLGLLVE